MLHTTLLSKPYCYRLATNCNDRQSALCIHIICVILEAAQKKPGNQTVIMMSVCQEAHNQIQTVPADKVFPYCSKGTYVPFWLQLSKWSLTWVGGERQRQVGCFLLLLKAIASPPLGQHISDLPWREELVLYLCKPWHNNFG